MCECVCVTCRSLDPPWVDAAVFQQEEDTAHCALSEERGPASEGLEGLDGVYTRGSLRPWVGTQNSVGYGKNLKKMDRDGAKARLWTLILKPIN